MAGFAFETVESFRDDPVLSGADTPKLILAVGTLKDGVTAAMMEDWVNGAVFGYAFAQYQSQGTEEVAIADASELVDSCRLVLVALGLTVKARRADKDARKPLVCSSLKHGLGPGGLFSFAALESGKGEASTIDAIKRILDLERWSEKLVARQKAQLSARIEREGEPKDGAPKNKALGPFFRTLEEIYFEAWNDIPTVSRSSSGGDWREANETVGQAGAVAETYVTGAELPVRFLRFLSDLFPLLAARGLPVPPTSVAIEQAVRRWWKEVRSSDPSLADIAKM